MRFDIVTIFPAMIEAGLSEGVVSRGVERGLLDVAVHDLRRWTTDRHRTVDDVPYGGGPGMVMKAEPLMRAVEEIRATRGAPDSVVLLSPLGFSPTGQAFNLSMEDVASATATALKADKLIFITEVPGVPDPVGKLMPEMSLRTAVERLQNNHLPPDVADYLRHLVKALKGGVPRALPEPPGPKFTLRPDNSARHR